MQKPEAKGKKLKNLYRKVLALLAQWSIKKLGDYPRSAWGCGCGFEFYGPLSMLFTEKGVVTHNCAEQSKALSDQRVQLIRVFSERLENQQLLKDNQTYKKRLEFEAGVYKEALQYLIQLENPTLDPDGKNSYSAIVKLVAEDALNMKLAEPHTSRYEDLVCD